MRVYCKTIGELEAPYKQWHTWYAWYPVFIPQTGYVWLEQIERIADPSWEGMNFRYRVK